MREKFTEGDNTNVFCNAACQGARYTQVKEFSDRLQSSLPVQLQSIDNITAAAHKMRALGFLAGLGDAEHAIGSNDIVGSLEFTIPRAVEDVKKLRVNLSESRGPSSVAIRAVAEEVYREMSAMFDAARSKIANAGTEYESNFTAMAKRLGSKALQHYKDVDGRAEQITESTGSPLVKLWSTVSVVKGLVASIASDVAERTNRTLERAKSLKKAVETMAHKDGLVQEIQSQLDQDMKEIGKEPPVDVGSTNVTIGASTQRLMAGLERDTSIKKQQIDAEARAASRKAASALLASELAMRGKSREAKNDAKKALSGFARGMVRQQEMVRNTLLDGVKAAKKAEKEMEWMARNEASEAAAYKTSMNATLTAFNRDANAASANAVGGFSEGTKQVSAKSAAEEERMAATAKLFADGLEKSRREKDVKIASVENATREATEANERLASAVQATGSGAMDVTREEATKAASAALDSIHTEEKTVGEDETRFREEARRSAALVNANEATMMAKVAEFDDAAQRELAAELAEIANNMTSLMSSLEGQYHRSDEEAHRAISTDGDKLATVMKRLKAARKGLLEMESSKRKMREEIGNSSGAAGKALDTLRDGFDTAIGKMAMKSAAEGAGSNLGDDISKMKSESDHIVEEEVARSTESLKSVSGHAIGILGMIAGEFAQAAEELKSRRQLLAQESANLTARWAVVKGRIDRNLAKAVSADLGLDPRALAVAIEGNMERMLLNSTRGLDEWVRSDEQANRGEVNRLTAATSEMEDAEDTASKTVDSLGKLLKMPEAAEDMNRLKLLVAGTFKESAPMEVANMLGSSEMEQEKNLLSFQQTIEGEIQQVKGPQVGELKEFAGGLLVSLEKALQTMESSTRAEMQHRKESEVGKIRGLKVGVLGAEEKELQGLDTIDAKDHAGSAQLGETLERMQKTLRMLTNNMELLSSGEDEEAARMSKEMRSRVANATEEASKLELDIGAMKEETRRSLEEDQRRIHHEIANASIEEEAGELGKRLADAQTYAVDVLTKRGHELEDQRRQIVGYQLSMAREEAQTRELERQIASSLA
ncbi:liver stage antigen-3, putative [Perkinsus marinus ATCC 50983]|uniref:Liver stage antigen-3, putative n=1 Tax=Perkinsus marinus (strain ATCC 50983 / TXsc) TaxID=423536 RepID=C5K9N2_PERM5|nr:liver stage antigen-3, putative [Perkinsus marinus ATCC 50983]EER18804.1 liver stage antigen-3, putative [Perkinsus marinus ATCC 50983]|eukprot:XP_002787008.1 liver stage antigen-3, putative [Perkinsus marinus ATCC 50983]